MKSTLAMMVLVVLSAAACTKASADVDPKAIEQKYGLSGGYVEDVSTEQGTVKATIIPTTINGKNVQLVIPHQAIGDHQVYMRDGITMTPLELSDPSVSKEQFVQSQPLTQQPTDAAAAAPPPPAAYAAPARERAPAPAAAPKKRSLAKQALIVGGAAGAGAGIGAIAGGGKGAGIGALSGGAAGLIYDLMTKDKK